MAGGNEISERWVPRREPKPTKHHERRSKSPSLWRETLISVTPDSTNPDRVVVTATITLFLEKAVLKVVGEEIEAAIRTQAQKDLKTSPEVKKLIAEAATAKLLAMLADPTPKA